MGSCRKSIGFPRLLDAYFAERLGPSIFLLRIGILLRLLYLRYVSRRFLATQSLFFTILFCCIINVYAQSPTKDTLLPAPTNIKTTLIRPNWVSIHLGSGYQDNAGNWAQRYAGTALFDLGAEYQHKEKWLIGFSYSPYTGRTINTDSLYGGIVGPSQNLYDINGNPAVIRTYLRGYNACLVAGRMWAIRESSLSNPRTWTMSVVVGAGRIEHYTKFQFDKGRLPQLENDYTQGYDGYRKGFCFSQQFRMQYMNPEALSFYVGVGTNQGITKATRDWDFGTFRASKVTQFDLGLNFTGGLIIPIVIRQSGVIKDAEYF